MERHRTGRPEVDALIATHAVEQDKLNAAFAISVAENTVTTARQSELAGQQQAARRRWSAARGLLTKAQKDGSAAKIAAARERSELAYSEFDRISDAVITEMHQITSVRLESTSAILEQVNRTWDAGSAVTDVLAQPARREPPAVGGGR